MIQGSKERNKERKAEKRESVGKKERKIKRK